MSIEVKVRVDRAVVLPKFLCDFCGTREDGSSVTLIHHNLRAALTGVGTGEAIIPVSEAMPRGWLRRTNQFNVTWHACPACVEKHKFPDQ